MKNIREDASIHPPKIHKHTRIYARAHACRGWKSKRGETAEYKGRDQGKQ